MGHFASPWVPAPTPEWSPGHRAPLSPAAVCGGWDQGSASCWELGGPAGGHPSLTLRYTGSPPGSGPPRRGTDRRRGPHDPLEEAGGPPAHMCPCRPPAALGGAGQGPGQLWSEMPSVLCQVPPSEPAPPSPGWGRTGNRGPSAQPHGWRRSERPEASRRVNRENGAKFSYEEGKGNGISMHI